MTVMPRMGLPKFDRLSLAEVGSRDRTHVGWLAWALGLLQREKQMHDSTKRGALHRLLPFPFSSFSPGDPMAPEETSVLASLPELDEQACGVRVVDGVGCTWGCTQLDPPWKARNAELFLGNISRPRHRMPTTIGNAAESSDSPFGRHRSSCASPRQELDHLPFAARVQQERLPGTRERNGEISWRQGCRQMSGLLV